MHVRSSTVGHEDIAASIATVRVPLYLSQVRTLAVTFTSTPADSVSFPQLDRSSAPSLSTASSSFSQSAAADCASKESVNKSTRRCETYVPLQSLTRLRMLILRCVKCGNCLSDGETQDEYREQCNTSFPALPRLDVLMMSGQFNAHYALLLSVPQQCRRLRCVSFHHQKIFPYLSLLRPDAVVQLLSFVCWLTTVNDTVTTCSDIERCTMYLVYLMEKGREVLPATAVEYVRLRQLSRLHSTDCRFSSALSPFRFTSANGPVDASQPAAWRAIRVLDMTELEGSLKTDLLLMRALPPLPALRYVLLPHFFRDDEALITDRRDGEGLFRWLSSCPRLTMVDSVMLHKQWPNAYKVLLESDLPRRLVLLQLFAAQAEANTLITTDRCFTSFFPSTAPSPFLALGYLDLAVAVTEDGRGLVPLANLQHLASIALAGNRCAHFRAAFWPWCAAAGQQTC